MVLNYIWVAFFVIAFIVALCKLIFMGDVEIHFPVLGCICRDFLVRKLV